MMLIISILIFVILYGWIGIYQPVKQIKKSTFSEKREWVKKLNR
jgi:hypothetical protein